MSFDPSEVLPWELVAVTGGNGEPEPVAAREVTLPADEYAAPWSRADWHITDPALASRHAHQVAEAARERAETRARVLARIASRETAPAPVVPAALPVRATERRSVPVTALPAGVELRRLAAAALLTCTALGPGRYRVEGGKDAHHVDLTADGAALPACDCADAHFREEYVCKHQLAARAAAGEAPLAGALAVLAGLANRGAVLATRPVTPTATRADAHPRMYGARAVERAA